MKLSLSDLRKLVQIILAFLFITNYQLAYAEETAITAQKLNQMIIDVKPVSPESNNPDEAMTFANKLRSISNAIKENAGRIIGSGNITNSINNSLIVKLKAIINIIEIQRAKLVEMITKGSLNNSINTSELDSIVEILDAQRTALSDLIIGESNSIEEQKRNIDKINNINNTEEQFSIFK